MKSGFESLSKIAFMICLISISWLSLSPADSVVQVGSYDKIVHLISYFVLSLTFFLGFQSIKHHFIFIIVLMFFGVLIEILQYFVPGRMMSLGDAVANSIGVVLGFLGVKLVLKFKGQL